MVTKWRQQPYGMDYQSKLFEHHQGMALCVMWHPAAREGQRQDVAGVRVGRRSLPL